MAWGLIFVVTAAVLLLAAVLAMLAVTHVYFLSGGRALERDGLPRGATAPAWTLPDTEGNLVRSPPTSHPLQLVVFTNHSVKSFPSLASGLQALADEHELDIVVLMRGPNDLAKPVLELLGLGTLPVVAGTQKLYGAYNVRVIPFAIFIDSSGRVRASSLVNEAWQVERLCRLAEVEPGPPTAQSTGRVGVRLGGSGR